MLRPLLAFFLLAATACSALAQTTRRLDDFHALHAAGPFDVVLERSNTNTVRTEGDADAAARVTMEVKDGTLRLGWEQGLRHGWGNNARLTVYVTCRQLDAIKSSGSGNLTCRAPLTGTRVEVANSGSGNLTLAALEAETVTVSNAGSGNMTLAGRVGRQELRVSGSGNVGAFGLVCTDAEVVISGSSNVDLNVTGALSARISGSGNVRYRGNPRLEELRTSGSGEVKRVN